MLKSLLKYDFKALNKVMIPLQLGVLVAGLLGTVCTNIFFRGIVANVNSSSYSSSSSTQPGLDFLIQSLASLSAVLLFSLVIVSSFITLILLARNIYMNFYSSEGYLTFTLPVTVNQHLLSKVISGLVWLLINAVVIAVSIFLLILFGFSNQGLINVDVLNGLGEYFSKLLTPLGILYVIEVIVVGVLSYAMSIYHIMFSIILGGTAARTHKVLAAIGIYLGIGTVVGILNWIISFFSLYVSDGGSYSSDISSFAMSQPTLLTSAALSIILIVVFHFISKILLQKSLNLE